MIRSFPTEAPSAKRARLSMAISTSMMDIRMHESYIHASGATEASTRILANKKEALNKLKKELETANTTTTTTTTDKPRPRPTTAAAYPLAPYTAPTVRNFSNASAPTVRKFSPMQQTLLNRLNKVTSTARQSTISMPRPRPAPVPVPSLPSAAASTTKQREAEASLAAAQLAERLRKAQIQEQAHKQRLEESSRPPNMGFAEETIVFGELPPQRHTPMHLNAPCQPRYIGFKEPYPHQASALVYQNASLIRYGRYHDSTPAGGGKTLKAAKSSQMLGLPLFVVGLGSTMEEKWRNTVLDQYGELKAYLSWDSMRGTSAHTITKGVGEGEYPVSINHPYLLRFDKQIEGKTKPIIVTRFEVTEVFRQLVQRGILLVVDEVHKAKNDSLQRKALSALTEVILGKSGTLKPSPTGSAVLSLSATLMDKAEHAQRVFQVLGLLPITIKAEAPLMVYERDALPQPTDAMDRFISVCRSLKPRTTDFLESEIIYGSGDHCWVTKERGIVVRYSSRHESNRLIEKMPLKTGPHRLAFFLLMCYVTIIQDAVACGTAVHFDRAGVTTDYKNVKFQVGNEDQQAVYNHWVQKLALAEIRKRTAESVEDKAIASQMESEALSEVEKAKGQIFYREVMAVLEANPKAKVFVSMHYLASINTLVERLANTIGVALVGKIVGGQTTAVRQAALDGFECKNASAHGYLRVVVSQMSASCSGIDLHSTDASVPHTTFFSPTSNGTLVMQTMSRTNRSGAQGHITVIGVYGASDTHGKGDEVKLMARLTKRSQVLKSVAPQQVAGGFPFPNDLPIYVQQRDFSLRLIDLERAEDPEEALAAAFSAGV